MTTEKIIVFSGPSLERQVIEKVNGLIWKPPAAQGDILRSLRDKPIAIAIIDGYFEGIPSVWHKEILWALSQGVKVFGASSMGALRAAETDAFGMIGVGRVYEEFRDGTLEDDDEIAVQHAPAELDFKALSVPMVNVRATIHQLISSGDLHQFTGGRLIEIAKSIFYQQRQWTEIFRIFNLTPTPKGENSSELMSLITENYIDLKRNDAIELVTILKHQLESANSNSPVEEESKTSSFNFEWSVIWDKIYNPKIDESSVSQIDQHIIDELRLDHGAFENFLFRVQARYLASQDASLKRIKAYRETTLVRLKKTKRR